METTAIEKRICHSNRSKGEGAGHGMGWGATWGSTGVDWEAEGARKHGKETVVWFPQERPGEEG